MTLPELKGAVILRRMTLPELKGAVILRRMTLPELKGVLLLGGGGSCDRSGRRRGRGWARRVEVVEVVGWAERGYRPGGWLTEWTGRIPDTVNNGRREEEGAPMPWKVSSVMEEKLRFILEYEGGEESMMELCQRYEISRETGYVTLRRYRASGLSGLLAQSHAAQR